MTQTAPIIYSRVFPQPRLAIVGRLTALAIAAACLAVLVTAAGVEPNPAGLGSHTGLGLQQCNFLQNTGLPCPSCGMTTSFAWFVRGNLLTSLYTQPMGLVLAVLTAAAFWVGLYVSLNGRPVYRLLRVVPTRYYVTPLLALAVLAWAWKIFLHLQ